MEEQLKDCAEEGCYEEKIKAEYYANEYEINIKRCDYGMVIRVGCKSFAFSSVDEAVENLNEYLTDPVKAIKKWKERIGRQLNKEL